MTDLLARIKGSDLLTPVLIKPETYHLGTLDLVGSAAVFREWREGIDFELGLLYTDRGLTGTNSQRPGLGQALAVVRAGDTRVVPKIDRLAPSVPDARAIADELMKRGVKLQLASTVHDPTDPMGKMFFNILATFAEFESDLIRLRTR